MTAGFVAGEPACGTTLTSSEPPQPNRAAAQPSCTTAPHAAERRPELAAPCPCHRAPTAPSPGSEDGNRRYSRIRPVYLQTIISCNTLRARLDEGRGS